MRFFITSVIAAAVLAAADSDRSGPLIVGGSEAKVGAYTWLVGLRSSRDGPNFCGGSLIDATHVLTAAHCINSNPSWVSVGSHFLAGNVDGQYLRIKTITPHPDYSSPMNMAYDLAVLELEQPVRGIDPIDLANVLGADDKVGTDAITAGWGKLTANGYQSQVKMEVTVPLLANRQCSNSYPNAIHASMICAGFQDGGKDACQCDSGGPLFTIRPDGTPALVGVVSWGSGCAQKGFVGVYARVTEAVAFIEEFAPHANFL